MRLFDAVLQAMLRPYYFYKSLIYFKKKFYPIVTPDVRLRAV